MYVAQRVRIFDADHAPTRGGGARRLGYYTYLGITLIVLQCIPYTLRAGNVLGTISSCARPYIGYKALHAQSL